MKYTIAAASGDILEDPTELIRLKNSCSCAAVVEGTHQLEANNKWGQCVYYVKLFFVHVHVLATVDVPGSAFAAWALYAFTSGLSWNKRADANPTGSAQH